MVKLTIVVDDIAAVIAVFTHIKLYYSDSETGTYIELAYVELVAGQSIYYYTHNDGTVSNWYKSSYWSTVLESGLSNAVQGQYGQLYHYPTYPSEISFDAAYTEIIRIIRRYIGDYQKLERLYIDDDSDTSCIYIQGDDKTIDIGTNGWPVYIETTLSGVSVDKNHLTDPVVQGYRYLTFSGTVGDNDVVDIWFYSSKFSDREIYESYGDTMIPPGLTADTVTRDHLVLQASIDLLENMTSEDMVDDGAVIRDDASVYDPSPGLKERDKSIKRLRRQLDALVKQYIMSGISGVLID